MFRCKSKPNWDYGIVFEQMLELTVFLQHPAVGWFRCDGIHIQVSENPKNQHCESARLLRPHLFSRVPNTKTVLTNPSVNCAETCHIWMPLGLCASVCLTCSLGQTWGCLSGWNALWTQSVTLSEKNGELRGCDTSFMLLYPHSHTEGITRIPGKCSLRWALDLQDPAGIL